MLWIYRWQDRARSWFRRAASERELDDEFAFHLECETAKNRSAGMNEADAARAARLSFGGGVQYREEVLDVWSGWPGRIAADVRWGVRRAWRQPSVALVVVLTLGLGIGANTAIFSMVKSVLWKPLPYGNADRLTIFWNRSGAVTEDTWLSAREVVEYRQATSSFGGIGAYTLLNLNLAVGEPERLRGALVTSNLLDVLEAQPAIGRAFCPSDEVAGPGALAILGHGAWQRHFGGSPDIIGREIRLSSRPTIVVGVMPAGFRLPLDYREERPTDVLLLDVLGPATQLAWGNRSYYVFGRLSDETTLTQAEAEFESTHARWERDVAELADDRLNDRAPLPVSDLVFRDVRRALALLFGAVGALLLIACANVAHLSLARGDARRRELAVQVALGAGRPRLATQLLAESSTLVLAGAAAGLAFAYLVLQSVSAVVPLTVIRAAGAGLDVQALAFAGLAALVVTVLSGTLPALRLSRVRLGEALAGPRGMDGSPRRSPRRLLVIGEVALSLMLVLCATLLAQSYADLRAVQLGFRTDNIVALRMDLPPADYPGLRAHQFYRDAVSRFGALPEVEDAGAVRVLPLTGTIGNWSITIEHQPAVQGENPNGDWQVVSPGYFDTMGIQIARGRPIASTDTDASPPVTVVNETMAARYWPGQDPIGKRFHLGTLDQPWVEIVASFAISATTQWSRIRARRCTSRTHSGRPYRPARRAWA